MNTTPIAKPSRLSRRAQLLKASPILMLAAQAQAMKAQGIDVVSLTVGEPDWDTYASIKQAGVRALEQGKTKYTPPAGYPELRAAIAEQISKDLGLKYQANEVAVSSGCKFALFSALQVLLNPGDEAILVAPYWASYTTMVEMADATPRVVVCDEKTQFKLTPAALEKAINQKTRILLLNSPSNPTGMVYSREELAALVEVLEKHPQIFILSDDIYNRLSIKSSVASAAGPSSSGSEVVPHILQVAPQLRDRVVGLNGASKSYAMTGWRIGWAFGPADIITAVANYSSQSVSCAPSVGQMATLAAIQSAQADVEESCRELVRRCDFICDLLKKIPHVGVHRPQGAFYLWIDVSAYMGKGKTSATGLQLQNSSDIAVALLQEQKVAVVPGLEFGLDGYLRLSFALKTPDAQKACDRMRDFFQGVRS